MFTTQECAALTQFRARICDILENLDQYDSHDKNLIRWLRARELNLDKAESMFRESMKWREENEVDKLPLLPYPERLLMELPFTPCGHDKEGTIICVVPFGRWNLKGIIVGGGSRQVWLYISQIFEKYFSYAKKTNSVENMKTQVILLFDYDQFSLQDFISKPVLNFLIEMLKIYEANYPERLKAAYVVNVPKVFEILWAMLKPFVPAHTLSKVHIYGGGSDHWRKALLKDIDYRELPSWYGGSNTAHPYYQNRHGETWPPRATDFTPEEFVTTIVPPKESFQKSYDLQPGKRISWNFKTDSYDICFEVRLNGSRMFPHARADAHICMQDGCFDVTEAAMYAIIFDNTYSKYRSKTLHYAIRVENTPASDYNEFMGSEYISQEG